MWVDKKTVRSSNQRTSRCCLSDFQSHIVTTGAVTMSQRTLGLTAAGNICCSNCPLGPYPIPEQCPKLRVHPAPEVHDFAVGCMDF